LIFLNSTLGSRLVLAHSYLLMTLIRASVTRGITLPETRADRRFPLPSTRKLRRRRYLPEPAIGLCVVVIQPVGHAGGAAVLSCIPVFQFGLRDQCSHLHVFQFGLRVQCLLCHSASSLGRQEEHAIPDSLRMHLIPSNFWS
jgi:hypothetical protein